MEAAFEHEGMFVVETLDEDDGCRVEVWRGGYCVGRKFDRKLSDDEAISVAERDLARLLPLLEGRGDPAVG